jgi:hypothetical protein
MLGLIHLIPIADLRLMESNWLPNWQHLRKPLLWTLAVTVCLLQLLAFPEGVWGMRKTRADRLLGKTCLAFVDILPDQPAVTRVLYHTPPQLKRAVASLTKLGLLNPPPFISSPTNLFPAAPQRTGGTKVPGVAWEGSLGQLEQLRWGQKGQFTVTGWAIAPSQKDMSDGVVLTCQTGNDIPRLLGVMDYRVLRSDLGVLWGRDPYLYAGWQKTFSLYDVPDGQLVFRAWVYDAERQTAFPLDGEESLGK